MGNLFNPMNPVIQTLMKGIGAQDMSSSQRYYREAWEMARDDYDRFLAAYFVGISQEHVYIVEPPEVFEDDPNLTDMKFPGNITCSYRSNQPLKITGEVTDWKRQSEESLQAIRDRLNKQAGKIINE